MAKTVLVTGATGFLATYVVKAFLDGGYNVRGTVRSAQKAEHLRQLFPDEQKFQIVEVKDLVTGDGLDDAFKGIDVVAHVASPYTLTVNDPYKDLLEPAIQGTLSVLRAAHNHGIKRVVLTSSFAAVTNLLAGGPWRDYTYTDKDFNPTTMEEAVEPGKPGPFVYSASKVLAEKAAHEFALEHNLELVAINPPMIYGPPLQRIGAKAEVNTSANAIYSLILPDVHKGQVPWNRLPLFCSVRDTALAHLRAAQADAADVAGKRFLICGGAFTWEDAIQHLQNVRPELASRLPELPADPTQYKDHGKSIAKIDCTPAREKLGFDKFETWQDTLEETIDALVKIEQNWQ
ncbi:hypothetical protein OIV83_000376 [Microbotryomycetes sp. JL201]|nr:hypothetical protein OIV83_000376 [Microbotryomycetes sp. JL201]